MIFLPFKIYNSNYGKLVFLYYEIETFNTVFVDDNGFIHIFEYDIELEENIIGLN
jgi:hypothetical protein